MTYPRAIALGTILSLVAFVLVASPVLMWRGSNPEVQAQAECNGSP